MPGEREKRNQVGNDMGWHSLNNKAWNLPEVSESNSNIPVFYTTCLSKLSSRVLLIFDTMDNSRGDNPESRTEAWSQVNVLTFGKPSFEKV